MFVTETQPNEVEEDLVGELLRHSGARLSDNLMLVGGNASLFVALCRRGFMHVCLAVAPCPRVAEAADILWLPHASAETLAAGRLRGFTHALREGGIIILHGDTRASRDQIASLRRLLRAEGFNAVRQVAKAGRVCLIARKPGRRNQACWRPQNAA